jgi:hypothetical protein
VERKKERGKKKRDEWVPCVGGWYGVLDMEVDECGEIGTGLKIVMTGQEYSF